jgi:hypothetical protein
MPMVRDGGIGIDEIQMRQGHCGANRPRQCSSLHHFPQSSLNLCSPKANLVALRQAIPALLLKLLLCPTPRFVP